MLRREGLNPFKHHPELPSAFAVFPRHARSAAEVVWIPVQGCSVFHFANSWEDPSDGTLVVIGCRSTTVTMARDAEAKSGERSLSFAETAAHMYLWRLDVQRGVCVEERRLSDAAVDFPQVDQTRHGRPSRFAYAVELLQGPEVLAKAGVDNPDALFYLPTVVKFDLEAALRGDGAAERRYSFHNAGRPGAQAYGTETVFAPRHGRGAGSAPGLERGGGDDGWLVSFSHDEGTGLTECHVIDAVTMRLQARLAMPVAVPFGFHAWWILGEDVVA